MSVICAHCGKAKVTKLSSQTWLYHNKKHFCSIQHFNDYHRAPVFDPRRLRPEAHVEQGKCR